jgi:hypothetical protein
VVKHDERKLIGTEGSPGLLNLVESGDLMLPEFQRPYMWGNTPDKTCRLLASIAQGWPAGSLLLMEGDRGFATSTVQNWVNSKSKPEWDGKKESILDGQQRLTALYLAYFGRDPRFTFVINIADILNTGQIIHGEDRRSGSFQALNKSELSSEGLSSITERAEAGFIEVKEFVSPKLWAAWIVEAGADPGELSSLRDEGALAGLRNYTFPVSLITKSSPMEALTTIFVEINRQGTPLSTFDLVTARTLRQKTKARAAFNLRDLWFGLSGDETVVRGDMPDNTSETYPLLRKFNSKTTPARKHGETPLKLLLLAEHTKSLSPGTIVEMDPDLIRSRFADAVKALDSTLTFLVEEISLIPDTLADDNYLLPVAVQFLKDPKLLTSTSASAESKKNRLVSWFWSSSLQMLFGKGRTADLVMEETSSLDSWVSTDTGEQPASVRDFWKRWDSAVKHQLVQPQQRNVHFMKALLALDVFNGAKDWIGLGHSEESTAVAFPLTSILEHWDETSLDIHHIWPQGGKAPAGKSQKKDHYSNGVEIPYGDDAINCVLNRCLLLKETNIVVGNTPFSGVTKIEGVKRDYIATYLLNPDARSWRDFSQARITSIESMIEALIPRI